MAVSPPFFGFSLTHTHVRAPSLSQNSDPSLVDSGGPSRSSGKVATQHAGSGRNEEGHLLQVAALWEECEPEPEVNQSTDLDLATAPAKRQRMQRADDVGPPIGRVPQASPCSDDASDGDADCSEPGDGNVPPPRMHAALSHEQWRGGVAARGRGGPSRGGVSVSGQSRVAVGVDTLFPTPSCLGDGGCLPQAFAGGRAVWHASLAAAQPQVELLGDPEPEMHASPSSSEALPVPVLSTLPGPPLAMHPPATASASAPLKRGRGRPKGSKSARKLEAAAFAGGPSPSGLPSPAASLQLRPEVAASVSKGGASLSVAACAGTGGGGLASCTLKLAPRPRGRPKGSISLKRRLAQEAQFRSNARAQDVEHHADVA
jgi:hypothetical protein